MPLLKPGGALILEIGSDQEADVRVPWPRSPAWSWRRRSATTRTTTRPSAGPEGDPGVGLGSRPGLALGRHGGEQRRQLGHRRPVFLATSEGAAEDAAQLVGEQRVRLRGSSGSLLIRWSIIAIELPPPS